MRILVIRSWFYVIKNKKQNHYNLKKQFTMSKQLIMMAIAIALFTVSCNNTPTTVVEDVIDVAVQPIDETVVSIAHNSKGQTLNMSFDNNKGEATFILGNDTIKMTQDTVASGIKYSNEKYEYNEHQGSIELAKEGKVIFKN
jgi:membrane-bound inhibitor of C-type lysozyme